MVLHEGHVVPSLYLNSPPMHMRGLAIEHDRMTQRP